MNKLIIAFLISIPELCLAFFPKNVDCFFEAKLISKNPMMVDITKSYEFRNGGTQCKKYEGTRKIEVQNANLDWVLKFKLDDKIYLRTLGFNSNFVQQEIFQEAIKNLPKLLLSEGNSCKQAEPKVRGETKTGSYLCDEDFGIAFLWDKDPAFTPFIKFSMDEIRLHNKLNGETHYQQMSVEKLPKTPVGECISKASYRFADMDNEIDLARSMPKIQKSKLGQDFQVIPVYYKGAEKKSPPSHNFTIYASNGDCFLLNEVPKEVLPSIYFLR